MKLGSYILFILFTLCSLVPCIVLAQATPRTTKYPVKVKVKPSVKPKSTFRPAAKPTTKPNTATQPIKPAVSPQPSAQPIPTAVAADKPVSVVPDTTFGVGSNVLNLGIGVGSPFSYDTDLYNVGSFGSFGGNTSSWPAISLSYERGIKSIGPGTAAVGIFIGYQTTNVTFGSLKVKHHSTVADLRGAFHFPVPARIDGYCGLGLGIRHVSTAYETSDQQLDSPPNVNYINLGIFIGGRYFFNDKVGAFAELGYDQTFLKVGLTARF